MLGVPVVEPLAVMREYVAVLRGALGAGAAFEGKHYRVHWSLALPTRPPAPPIFLAALGPKMCELAGEIADGAILWLCTPDYVRDVARPAIERGRRRAGKTLEGFEIVAAVPLAVTDDAAGARAAFRTELGRYASLPFYRAMMEASGLREALRAYDRDGTVPESMAAALGGVGDAAAARAYLEAYRQAGVTLPAVRPITFPDAPWYRRTLEEAAALVIRFAASGVRRWRRGRCGWRRVPGCSAAPARPAAGVPRRRCSYVALGDSTVEGSRGQLSPATTYVARLHARLRAVYPRAAVDEPRCRRRHLGRRRPRSARARDAHAAKSGDGVDRAQRHHRPGPGGGVRAQCRDDFPAPHQGDERGRRRQPAPGPRGDAALPRAEAEPVLGSLTMQFNEALSRQARRHGVEVVDLYEPSRVEIPGRPELMAADGYHPSDLGYARWAELLWAGIERHRVVH